MSKWISRISEHLILLMSTRGFPGGSDSESVCLQCGRPGFDSWVGKIPWRRKWQSTSALLLGKSHGRRSLIGYSPWGCKELDTTEWLQTQNFTDENTWGSREITWLIGIMQLFSGWYWDWLSASCFLLQTAVPTCPEEWLTLGWGRLSQILLCHVRVGGVALIHSASSDLEISLIKATQDLHFASSCGYFTVFMLHELSTDFNRVDYFLLEILSPPDVSDSTMIYFSLDHFVWSPLLNSLFRAGH